MPEGSTNLSSQVVRALSHWIKGVYPTVSTFPCTPGGARTTVQATLRAAWGWRRLQDRGLLADLEGDAVFAVVVAGVQRFLRDANDPHLHDAEPRHRSSARGDSAPGRTAAELSWFKVACRGNEASAFLPQSVTSIPERQNHASGWSVRTQRRPTHLVVLRPRSYSGPPGRSTGFVAADRGQTWYRSEARICESVASQTR